MKADDFIIVPQDFSFPNPALHLLPFIMAPHYIGILIREREMVERIVLIGSIRKKERDNDERRVGKRRVLVRN